MSTSNFFVRGLADLVVGIAAVGGFIAASKNGETADVRDYGRVFRALSKAGLVSRAADYVA